MPQKKTAKTKRTSKKPKVYIPAYKAIILCCAIITICMALLLVTTLHDPNRRLSDATIERYKEEIIDSKKEPEKEPEARKGAEAEKKTEALKKQAEASKKQSESSKKQSDASKNQPESPKKQSDAYKNPAEDQSQNQSKAEKIETPQAKAEAPEQEAKPAAVPAAKSKYNFPKAKNNAQLIFVFDDGGQRLDQLAPFLKLPFPITVAVLPQLQYSAEAAAQVRRAGFELILHQPMQALNAGVNPGPGAIKPDMGEEKIKAVLFQNVTGIGPVAGMNNHEGSAITADAEKMAVVLQFCSQEGIYFLDSRTNVDTQVPYVAGELGYSWYERNIFLDNEKTEANALKELKKGLDLANKNGSVIMIGHIWSADFLPAFLQNVYPELKDKGYTFSTVSKSKARKN